MLKYGVIMMPSCRKGHEAASSPRLRAARQKITVENGTMQDDQQSGQKSKRSSVACSLCRRGRRRCIQDVEGILPCRACKAHGRVRRLVLATSSFLYLNLHCTVQADQCVMGTPGTSRKDREVRLPAVVVSMHG